MGWREKAKESYEKRFVKKEHTSFVKDAEGTVHAMQLPQDRPKYKPTKQLEQEYQSRQIKMKPVQPNIGFFNPLNRVDTVPIPYKKHAPRSPSFKPYYPTRGNRNPFHSMFDMGLPNTPNLKKTRTQYAVVVGKAYPIAKTGKKKKTKSRRKDPLFGFDMLGNNWGL